MCVEHTMMSSECMTVRCTLNSNGGSEALPVNMKSNKNTIIYNSVIWWPLGALLGYVN